MSSMRLIVAGAGGRMGRTLVKAIADTAGAVVTGAVEAAGSPLIGQDAGVLAGLPPNGVKLTADLAPLLDQADGILDFTIPAATLAVVALASKHKLVHVIGTTGFSADEESKIAAAAKSATVKSCHE